LTTERLKQLANLSKRFHCLLLDLERKVGSTSLTDISAIQADLSTRRDRLRSFVQSVKKDVSGLEACQIDEMIEPFSSFLEWWCDAFRDCTQDPVANPYFCLEPAGLEKQGTMINLCTYAEGSIDNSPIHLVNMPNTRRAKEMLATTCTKIDKGNLMLSAQSREVGWLQVGGSKLNYFRPQDAGWCTASSFFPCEVHVSHLKINFLSRGHLTLVVVLLAGAVGVVAEMAAGCVKGAALISIALMGILLSLGQLEARYVEAALDEQEEWLDREQEVMTQSLWELDKYDSLIRLWRCRTLPRLDIVEALAARLPVNSWAAPGSREFLCSSVRALSALDQSLGDIRIWMEPKRLTEDMGELLRSRVATAWNFIEGERVCILQAQMVGLICAPAHALFVSVQKVNNMPQGQHSNFNARMRMGRNRDWTPSHPLRGDNYARCEAECLFMLHRGCPVTEDLVVQIEILGSKMHAASSSTVIAEATAVVSAGRAGEMRSLLLPLSKFEGADVQLDILYMSEACHWLALPSLPKTSAMDPMPGGLALKQDEVASAVGAGVGGLRRPSDAESRSSSRRYSRIKCQKKDSDSDSS
jgi:hypothetical protein